MTARKAAKAEWKKTTSTSLTYHDRLHTKDGRVLRSLGVLARLAIPAPAAPRGVLSATVPRGWHAALWFMVAAVAGNGRLVGFGLVLAGASDFLDGYIARRLRAATPRGARLDALADNLLLLSALACLLWLHPKIITTSGALIGAACAVHATSWAAGQANRTIHGNG